MLCTASARGWTRARSWFSHGASPASSRKVSLYVYAYIYIYIYIHIIHIHIHIHMTIHIHVHTYTYIHMASSRKVRRCLSALTLLSDDTKATGIVQNRHMTAVSTKESHLSIYIYIYTYTNLGIYVLSLC